MKDENKLYYSNTTAARLIERLYEGVHDSTRGMVEELGLDSQDEVARYYIHHVRYQISDILERHDMTKEQLIALATHYFITALVEALPSNADIAD